MRSVLAHNLHRNVRRDGAEAGAAAQDERGVHLGRNLDGRLGRGELDGVERGAEREDTDEAEH